MALQGKNVLITGASMGIGEKIAITLAKAGANVMLFARSKDKLESVAEAVRKDISGAKVSCFATDVQDYEAVQSSVEQAVKERGQIDVLINNAGLALGAPAPFQKLSISQILQMNNTNVNGTMFATYAVLNASMVPRNSGTVLNVSSTTALEAPPFPGEAVYHANKACMEGFTNALRNELCGTDIKVLALRPGVVDTHFHTQRVGFDKELHGQFMEGFDPLEDQNVADAALYMLSQPLNVSIKALDLVPTAQRSLNVFDREWRSREAERK